MTTTYAGMDAHAATIRVAVLAAEGGRPEEWQLTNEPKAVTRLAQRLKRVAPGLVVACYEAGPGGFAPCRPRRGAVVLLPALRRAGRGRRGAALPGRAQPQRLRSRAGRPRAARPGRRVRAAPVRPAAVARLRTARRPADHHHEGRGRSRARPRCRTLADERRSDGQAVGEQLPEVTVRELGRTEEVRDPDTVIEDVQGRKARFLRAGIGCRRAVERRIGAPRGVRG